MMKKLYKIFLIGTMSLMLVACGNNKTNDDAISVEEETEEEFVEEETEEEVVTEEEPVTEEVAVEEETKTTEYQLTQMNSGFYGGIAWATIADDTGTKKVLINKDLQVVYELPEGKEVGDIFDGKAVVINSDQASNPGFMILGADGTVLYECSDNLIGESYPGYNINFTKDGSTIYERKESGLTANTAFSCILNDKFETVAEIEIPDYSGNSNWIDEQRFYYYLSDGVYCCNRSNINSTVNEGAFILNAKEHNTVAISGNDGALIRIYQDMDRCAGFELNSNNTNNMNWMVVNAENIDYSGVTDKETLSNLAETNGKVYYNKEGMYAFDLAMPEYDFDGSAFAFNHGFVDYTVQNGIIKGIEGIEIPDFGAEISNFRLSNDGKYVALQLKGADGNAYYTVISSDGQKLYDPISSEQIYYNTRPNYSGWCGDWGVCDGYIMCEDGSGITPDGKVFKLGDGTDLSDIGENSLLYFSCSSDSGEYILSNGYVVWKSKLYQSDGTEITTVTAVN